MLSLLSRELHCTPHPTGWFVVPIAGFNRLCNVQRASTRSRARCEASWMVAGTSDRVLLVQHLLLRRCIGFATHHQSPLTPRTPA